MWIFIVLLLLIAISELKLFLILVNEASHILK